MVRPQSALTDADQPDEAVEIPAEELPGTDRRRFLGYLVAAPTLVVAVQLGLDATRPERAGAVIGSLPEPADLFDLGQLLTLAGSATQNLISVALNSDGTVSFALPRAEVGQGLTTAIAMVIAEEIGLNLPRVDM